MDDQDQARAWTLRPLLAHVRINAPPSQAWALCMFHILTHNPRRRRGKSGERDLKLMESVFTFPSRIESQNKNQVEFEENKKFILYNWVCWLGAIPVTFIKTILKFGRRRLRRAGRHLINELGTDENKQINNSTEGILMFKNVGHATCESFLYAMSFACVNLSSLPNNLMRIAAPLSPIHRLGEWCS